MIYTNSQIKLFMDCQFWMLLSTKSHLSIENVKVQIPAIATRLLNGEITKDDLNINLYDSAIHYIEYKSLEPSVGT